ncbi:hypothetical protein GW17_00030856 [Ensete ventricosum]|nr:hypothetical protein GW17_00030856 [Ensete ventricosum]
MGDMCRRARIRGTSICPHVACVGMLGMARCSSMRTVSTIGRYIATGRTQGPHPAQLLLPEGRTSSCDSIFADFLSTRKESDDGKKKMMQQQQQQKRRSRRKEK